MLKALALVLTEQLKPRLSRRCLHLTGTGGLKGDLLAVARQTVERCVARILALSARCGVKPPGHTCSGGNG